MVTMVTYYCNMRQALMATCLLLLFFDATSAWMHQPQPKVQRNISDNQSTNQMKTAQQSLSRRHALRHAFVIAPIVATAIQPIPANALDACRPNSQNCIRTTWTAPSSATSSAEAAKTIRDVLNSYPQKGQAGVDCSGWKVVNDALDAEASVIELEYKSCVGPAALAINLAQPFTDDLKVELGKNESKNIVAEVKSSSRVGGSDLGVNRKRLQYLAKELKGRGWSVPAPKYGSQK